MTWNSTPLKRGETLKLETKGAPVWYWSRGCVYFFACFLNAGLNKTEIPYEKYCIFMEFDWSVYRTVSVPSFFSVNSVCYWDVLIWRESVRLSLRNSGVYMLVVLKLCWNVALELGSLVPAGFSGPWAPSTTEAIHCQAKVSLRGLAEAIPDFLFDKHFLPGVISCLAFCRSGHLLPCS